MENKYYVPEISEFYVGFECERDWRQSDPNGAEHASWEKCVVEPSLWSSNQMWLLTKKNDSSLFRVKYLDKEDIESLGFKYRESLDKERDVAGNWKEVVRSGYFKDDWYLSYFDTGYLMIREVTELSEYPEMRFLGKIKNKSELKILLKQLSING